MLHRASCAGLEDERLLRCIREATRVAVLTGAGISAESGIPTFRGNQGLWGRFRPEELASFDAFLANPERVWEWYRFRRDVVRRAEPHAGHFALAEWERRVPAFTLITQNVDGLHARAGSRRVVELHGNIERDRCQECGAVERAGPETPGLPRCACGGRLRPDVVWFGELLPAGAMAEAERAACDAELFVSVGTSAVVQPAASLPALAKRAGAILVEVNPEVTPVSAIADFTLYGTAGQVLPALLSSVTA